MTTGIRGILTAIISPSEDAKKVIKELGIEFDASTLASKGFSHILIEMQKAVGDDADKMEKLAAIFPNVRGLIGALALDAEKYTEALDAMSKGTKEFKEATKIMINDTTNQLAILKNNMMAKLKPLGDSILKEMNNIAKGINIAMSGANDEMSKLARSYSELADTLQRKQSRIDTLIKTVEDLRSKTKLTKEETTQLHAAEKALAVYFPTLGKAAEDAAASIDVLSLAKEGTIDLSIRIMELELEQAKINQKRADLALKLYKSGEDEDKKEIERLQEKKDRFLNELSLQQIIEQQTTGQIKEYILLENELSNITEKRTLEQRQLILDTESTTVEVDALTDSLEKLRKTREKPIIIPKPNKEGGGPDEDIISTGSIDTEFVEDKLNYMASQYKKYTSDIAQFGEEYVEEHNTQLAKDAENYGIFLDEMLEKYAENADLTKEIMDDIYEYNKAITAKRKEDEEKYFEYITEARGQELKAEEDKYKIIIKNYKEGSDEYLKAIEKHKLNEIEINARYDKEIADAALTIFKENLERQTGETDISYKKRLEVAREGLYKETEANKAYFEYVTQEIKKLTIIEEKAAKEKRELLDSYFSTYQTTEEKIVSIHKKTAELLKLTDNKYEKERLKAIEERLIAEIEYSEAMEEIFGEDRNSRLKKMNNEQLRNYIAFLEEMKIKYSNFADIIIQIDEKIAESQSQLWDNVQTQFDQVAGALNDLASVVGNFNTELEQTINEFANLVSGIGQISLGIASGNIFSTISGIATVISSIISLFIQHKTEVPELLDDLSKITIELQKQETILNQSTGENKIQAIEETIELLNEQIDVYNELIAAEKEAYGQFLWWTWDETDQASIEGWLSSIENVNTEIYNLNQQYQQILTGTTAETIADTIAEGFESGLDSAQIFADTFNDMLKTAIVDAFKRTIVSKYLEHWLAGFTAFSEGGLTAEEMATLAERYLMILQSAEDQWDTIQDLLESVGIQLEDAVEDIASGNVTGLTGAIAGITEDTAGLLAGQFQAIRINTVEVLNHMESIITINSRIADNTEYNKYLEHISKKLDEGSSFESESLRAIGGA